MTALIDLAIGSVGASLLWATFRALQMRWPESYFAIEDVLSQRISISPIRYAAFRFAPVLLIGGFAAVTSSRAGGNPWFAGLTVGMIHAWMTAGRATIVVIRRSGLFARRSLLAYHTLVTVGVVVAAGAGVLMGQTIWFPEVVPSIPELRSNLWTALFAAALGAYFVRITQGEEPSAQDLMHYSRAKLGPDLVDFARQAARSAGVDEDLVESILLVENLQRPKWIRRLERIVGPFVKVRTYGVMQVRSDRPISDEESIRIAIDQHLIGRPLLTTAYGPDSDDLMTLIRSYNSNPRFVELVSEVYTVVWSERQASS